MAKPIEPRRECKTCGAHVLPGFFLPFFCPVCSEGRSHEQTQPVDGNQDFENLKADFGRVMGDLQKIFHGE